MKKWIIIIAVLAIAGISFAALGYLNLMKKITSTEHDLYIKTGSSLEEVRQQLIDEKIVEDISAFDFTAKLLQYNKIYAGKYHIESGWSTLRFVRKLRSGSADPVNVTFHNVRTLQALAGKIAPYIEADSMEILTSLKNNKLWSDLGVDDAVFCHLIPNTYSFFWNTSGDEFVTRMAKEAKLFWNEERLQKAQEVGLSPCEIANLAAIVQEEQSAILAEQSTIAGLYLNRLRTKMPLQADPTLKYAANDFSLKRIYNVHKEIESPYNTYKYAGLPPTPIVIPEINAIDAVLNNEKHEYYYMCAKDDFSGYHYFSKTLAQHTVYAIRWRRALEKRK